MNYLKFTQYAYLGAGILFAVEAFRKFQAGETGNAVLMGLITIVCIFMFFFRKRYAKRFENHNKKQ